MISYLVGVLIIKNSGALVLLTSLSVVQSIDRSLFINSLLSLPFTVVIDIYLDCCNLLMYSNLFFRTISVRVGMCNPQ